MDIILAEVQIYQIAFFFATLFSLLGGIAYFFFRLLKKKSSLQNTSPNDKPESWGQRLSRGLEKSREEVWGKLSSLISSSQLSEEQIEEIEELLYSADMGATLVEELKDSLKVFMKKNDVTSSDLKNFLYDFLFEKLNPVQKSVSMDLLKYQSNQKLKVIMIVGVNGAGKTTTIGKLATKLKNQGAKVVVGACDTFRAGAVDQLQVWCDRAQVTMIRAKEGNDPSGVAFESLESAKKMGADYCLLDTAGRLHTAKNLME